jgi:hypothetical protein
VQAHRVGAEALEQPLRRQREVLAQAEHAELVEKVAQRGLEIEPVERHVERGALLARRVAHHQHRLVEPAEHRLVEPAERVGAEAGEADRDADLVALGGERGANRLSPRAGGGEQALQPGAGQPEHAGIARLDVGREAPQPLGELVARDAQLVLRDDAGAQARRQRQPFGVALAGQHALLARGLADPEDFSARLILLHHRGGEGAPVGVRAQQQLERERREINAGQPVHSPPLRAPTRGLAVCP